MTPQSESDDLNYWPAVADLILATLMVVLLLWVVGNIHAMVADLAHPDTPDTIHDYAELQRKYDALLESYGRLEAKHNSLEIAFEKLSARNLALETENVRLVAENVRLAAENKELTGKNAALLAENQQFAIDNATLLAKVNLLTQENEKLEEENEKLREKPPIITLDEASGYSFGTASADLSPAFKRKLNEIEDQLVQHVERYDVDVIEIIGHTDGEAFGKGRVSNLDKLLNDAIREELRLDDLKPGSNADLGLMRALSVAQYLGKILPKEFGANFRIYSAANSKPRDADLGSGADSANARDRRIELRFTKLK